MTNWAKVAKIIGKASSASDREALGAIRKAIQAAGGIRALKARVQHGGPEGVAAATRKCRVCGTDFVGKRTARYCSSLCRVRAHRAKP
jgi:hypothetical protein